MKYVVRFANYVSCSILIAFVLGSTASAVSYDVSASVPFPPPTQAAIINPALNNLTVQNAAFLIAGTCQVLSPVSVVSVWRGSTNLGSQNCTTGTFSMQIILAEGSNTLIVKTANVSNVYGPDSSPILVTLRFAQTPAASNNTPGATNLSPADNAAFNNGVTSGLNIVPQEPFSVLPEGNLVTLSFHINGGSTPYTVELNWGDGTTESKVVDKPGLYAFTHRYRNTGNYSVKALIKDVLGATTEINHAVVVANRTSDTSKANVTKALAYENPVLTWLSIHWLAILIGISTFIVVGSSYWLGRNAATRTSTSVASPQVLPKASRKSSKPKTKRKK